MIVLGSVATVRENRFPAFSSRRGSTKLRDVGKAKTIRMDADGQISTTIYFRHLLFIAIGLAVFRETDEIIKLSLEEIKTQVTEKHVELVRKWMNKLKADPEMLLLGKQKRWGEIYKHYLEARKGFLEDFSEEPLAHSRGRFIELKDLYQMAKEGNEKLLFTIVQAKDPEGNLLYTKSGKPVMVKAPVLMKDPDVQTAANILKQIAQETGGMSEKHEHIHIHSMRNFIDQAKTERGLLEQPDDSHVDNVVDAQFTDITPTAIKLSSPVEDSEDQHVLTPN